MGKHRKDQVDKDGFIRYTTDVKGKAQALKRRLGAIKQERQQKEEK